MRLVFHVGLGCGSLMSTAAIFCVFERPWIQRVLDEAWNIVEMIGNEEARPLV